MVPMIIGVALLASPRLAPVWLSSRVLPRAPVTDWIGMPLIAAGIVFSIWARRHLAGWWSSNVTLKHDHQLIRSGPYRYARHPIYTGLLLALLGTAISIGEWRGFLGVLVIAFALLHKISIEETFLTEAFPGDYPRYRAEVAALIPFLY
jgi:protein-S-isoprenylcysteine O-methyltransferase Ste14